MDTDKERIPLVGDFVKLQNALDWNGNPDNRAFEVIRARLVELGGIRYTLRRKCGEFSWYLTRYSADVTFCDET